MKIHDKRVMDRQVCGGQVISMWSRQTRCGGEEGRRGGGEEGRRGGGGGEGRRGEGRGGGEEGREEEGRRGGEEERRRGGEDETHTSHKCTRERKGYTSTINVTLSISKFEIQTTSSVKGHTQQCAAQERSSARDCAARSLLRFSCDISPPPSLLGVLSLFLPQDGL